jgi:hypothetical protein
MRKLRFVFLALVGAAVLSFAGCTKKAAPQSADGAKAAVGIRDLGGAEVVIGNWWADWDVNSRTANSTAEEDLIAWRKKIQQDANVKIHEKNISSWE